jgi:DNA polymerase-3 subunit delta'
VRVNSVSPPDVVAFLEDPSVQRRLAGTPQQELVKRAGGAPGELFASSSTSNALAAAKKLLDAALRPGGPDATAERMKAATRQGVAGARGAFTDTLEALTLLLHDRVRRTALEGHQADARRAAQGIVLVEQMRLRAYGNVSPQLLAAALVEDLHRTMRP